MNKVLKIIISVLFVAVAAIFVANPTKYMQSFFDGITVWAYNVLPALFPFMVLTALFTKCLPQGKFSFTKKMFSVACDDVFAMSLLCGYPVGAKAISESDFDAETASRICSFCSTAGPIFVIATVGAKLLQSGVATLILLTSQLGAAVLNGFVFYRKTSPAERRPQLCNKSDFSLSNAVTNSALSVISVGGLIALFYMLTDMLKSFLPTSISSSVAVSYLVGLLEMTNGIIGISKQADLFTATVLCSSLLALGGLCVFLQCYSYLAEKKIKAKAVLLMKLTQSAFATIISFILCRIFLRG